MQKDLSVKTFNHSHVNSVADSDIYKVCYFYFLKTLNEAEKNYESYKRNLNEKTIGWYLTLQVDI